jgi:hypothetical protein
MAETANPSGSDQRRSKLTLRILMVASAALFFGGVIAFVQVRGDDQQTAARPAENIQPASQPDVLPKTGGKLTPAARKVAGRFIVTALNRTHLAEVWELAAPELRNAVTRKQWLAGEMPFPPYPVRSLKSTRFTVITTAPDKILLQVLLLPKIGADEVYEPIRYDMTLIKQAGRWVVSYMVPYAPLGRYSAPDG